MMFSCDLARMGILFFEIEDSVWSSLKYFEKIFKVSSKIRWYKYNSHQKRSRCHRTKLSWIFYFNSLLCLNPRNLYCSNGEERLRKSWRHQSSQWRYWFIAWCFVLFSLLVNFLSVQSGQEVYCEDWLQQYLHWCFSPFCPHSSLCLELQQETTSLPD